MAMLPIYDRLGEAVWQLYLQDAGDFCSGYILEHEVLDQLSLEETEWLSKDFRKWVLDCAALTPAQIEWLERNLDADTGEVLPDLAGMTQGFWLVCEDGIAGGAVDVDGGRAVQVLEWEEIL